MAYLIDGVIKGYKGLIPYLFSSVEEFFYCAFTFFVRK